MEELFTIRNAEEADLPTLTAYSYAEGMGDIDRAKDVYVAVNADGDIVGFIRLTYGDDGICHVNPVVVYPSWRRTGVGRALVERALDENGELRLVSRGSSLAFYESMGFEPIGWDEIYWDIVAECDECELFDECNPVPVRKRK